MRVNSPAIVFTSIIITVYITTTIVGHIRNIYFYATIIIIHTRIIIKNKKA